MVFDRTKCLYNMFGWQGGTVHQLSEELGVSVQDILYSQFDIHHEDNFSYQKGYYAYNECSPSFVRDNLLNKFKGDSDFWLGYMKAYIIDKA